ncbi:alpha-amylase family glycosyl hydrolase [Halobacillus seohaensis]|uniref:Alpha-amylase family glycosyl hydrolase n=1 Tax=Halobacillus seohaensis TaxID=447421 RepID=A0ABW2EM88_9BACI
MKNNSTNGIFYEIYVNSFYDSNGDGHGDLNGITAKLDYLNDGNPHSKKSLQVDGLWLMPINPSPSYHKYDVTDYYSVDPIYGTLADFQNLVSEAHKRNTKVIIDLVINHTSSEHPWFKEASSNPNSNYRDYYVWADDETDLGQRGAWGQELWHKNPNGEGFYYGVFWHGMPDLNFDHQDVRKEMKDIGRFWLNQGVDGFRLDAALYIYDGDTEEGADKNIQWWNDFRDAMKKTKQEAYLVGEVWHKPQVIAPYYQSLDSLFNFDLASTIVRSVNDTFDQGVVTTAMYTDELYNKYNHNKIDAIFLTNHDQNRVMSELYSIGDKAKSAASILLTLPGNPFLYYGEEIGMTGEKPDELIREPFRWYEGDGEGQTSWETPQYNTGDNGVSVEAQDHSKDSLLNHYRELIRLRHKHVELQKGDLQEIQVSNPQIIAFTRSYQNKSFEVYHNISDQAVAISVSRKGKKIYSSHKDAKKRKSILVLPSHTTVLIKNKKAMTD